MKTDVSVTISKSGEKRQRTVAVQEIPPQIPTPPAAPARPSPAMVFAMAQRGMEDAVLKQLLTAAVHALRSYEHGNGSPELAKMVADEIEARLPMLGGAHASRAPFGEAL